jgi:hypothetical protein
VVAASLTAVEAFVLLALGGLELAHLNGIRLTMGLTTTAFFLGAAAALAWCAWSLWKARRWARGPVVMAQLIQLGLAWNLRDEPALAAPLALAAGGAIAAMLQPASLEALMGERFADDED